MQEIAKMKAIRLGNQIDVGTLDTNMAPKRKIRSPEQIQN